jgi:hypothetical protein
VIKYYKLIIKNFDQLKKHNFDQVQFDQVIISLCNVSFLNSTLTLQRKSFHLGLLPSLQLRS